MKTQHQAFVFDETGYRRELALLLIRKDTGALTRFVDEHWARLRDPKTGTPLQENWYPEGRVFVQGGQREGVGGYYQSAEYVAESVAILEEYPRKLEIIDPVLTMLKTAADASKGLYILL